MSRRAARDAGFVAPRTDGAATRLPAWKAVVFECRRSALAGQAGSVLRRLVGGLVARLRRLCGGGRLVVDGRVGAPGACAERLPGQADWTLRLALVDARIGRARLGEPLQLHRRCAPDELQALLVSLPQGARLVARVELDRGNRMQARLHVVIRIDPVPPAHAAPAAGTDRQKNARTPNDTPRPGSGA